MTVSLTRQEISVLLSVLHGAMDDADEHMPAGYVEALSSANATLTAALKRFPNPRKQ